MKLEEFDERLKEKNLVGHWSIVGRSRSGLHPEPVASFGPRLWKWADVYGALADSGQIVDLAESGRRFIGFCNPPLAMQPAHTLLLGAQLVKPGEIAPAHRHTMGAIRFVVKGNGACTTVNGEPFPMEEGDLITTPNRAWHDHFNGSGEPIIWLDGGDGPLLQFLQVGFHENFPAQQQPRSRPAGLSGYEMSPSRPSWIRPDSIQPPPYRYAWSDTEKILSSLGENPGDPFEGVLLKCVNPLTNGPTLPTLSCEIQMLRPGEETKPHRHTSTVIYHAFRGKGFSIIDGIRWEWEQGDSFVVPLWQRHRHGNCGSEPAVLFSMNDRPVMESLGFYREED
jgi:1-hydroxy-2-naphthoate dioxygenase